MQARNRRTVGMRKRQSSDGDRRICARSHITYFLGVDHSDLTDQGTNVDKHVKVHEQSSGGECWVDQQLFALFVLHDDSSLTNDLFGDHWRNV